ncbi:MAG: TlyA family RNA methyltransferase [Deltaproteobacteria bacterium]|nr:TlyA family RNA methyltransferase [Candidatus Zymogenaceae bacterium]
MKPYTARDKLRLDTALVEGGLVPSREKARAVIMAGHVLVNGDRVDKAGFRVSTDDDLSIVSPPHPYVSRGGVKLQGALDEFGHDPGNAVALDVGASTGGFTDCLLKSGAQRVYSLDVGYGQFAWSLRSDPKVVLMERTNIRHTTIDAFPEPIDLAVIDVSFVSLSLVLPRVFDILTSGGYAIALIKPQFEVGRGDVGKGGVVRDEKKHKKAVDSVAAAAQELGFVVKGTCTSPLMGPKGNTEFFIYLYKPSERVNV